MINIYTILSEYYKSVRVDHCLVCHNLLLANCTVVSCI